MKQLLSPKQLFDYQKECVLHSLYKDDSMLWLQMGLGKTPITLTVMVDRMRAGQVRKTLIFGPLRVIQAVWHREALKWEHTRHLRFSIMHGDIHKRRRALFADADVYLCNYENMNWLAQELAHYYVSQKKPIPFDMVVYDEVSKLKNSTTMRMAGGTRDRVDNHGTEHRIKILGWRRMIDLFKYRMGLTGTPASNGYLDLHGQFLAVDGGQRLGEYITHYKDSYFTSDYNGWGFTPTAQGKQLIEHQISDITKKMDAKDYLDMPACKVTNVMVELPPKSRKAYEEVEQEMFTQLDTGSEIELFSKSSVSNKCLQFCLAEGTEILTDSGWKPIENFNQGDCVWDGVEWVNVHSLAFQGVKKVVQLDGVWMTPDHRVLTVAGWMKAEDILAGDSDDKFNRAEVWLPHSSGEVRVNHHEVQKGDVASEMHLRQRVQGYWSKLDESEQNRCEVVRVPTRGNYSECDRLSWDVENTSIHSVDKHEVKVQEPEGQGLSKLWCSWNRRVRVLVQQFRQVLGRHGRCIPVTSHDRKSEQQRRVPPIELSMGNAESSVEQQTGQSLHINSNRKNHGDTGSQTLWFQRCDTFRQNTKRMEGARTSSSCRVEKTYDLINSGERNRFTVRGKTGKVFIVHNCNGAPYIDLNGNWEALHDAKLSALEDILEEAAGRPVLCSYSFKSDAARIMKKFKSLHPINMTETPPNQTEKIINDWNSGKIKLLIGHPASMGHGIDGLQDSGSIVVWFGINWSLELYEQMNGRIERQGQKQPVSIIRILCADTVDLAVADAIERKFDDQEGLKSALQRYRDGITTNELTVNFF